MCVEKISARWWKLTRRKDDEEGQEDGLHHTCEVHRLFRSSLLILPSIRFTDKSVWRHFSATGAILAPAWPNSPLLLFVLVPGIPKVEKKMLTAALFLAVASLVLAGDHFGPSQLIGRDGKPFYIHTYSRATDETLEIRSIHDFYHHDESGRRIQDPKPSSTFWKSEIHVIFQPSNLMLIHSITLYFQCDRDLCGIEIDLFASDYMSKFEDVSCIRDGGSPRVYFFPSGVAHDDYRHVIKHDITDFTVDGISALLGAYGFRPSYWCKVFSFIILNKFLFDGNFISSCVLSCVYSVQLRN